MDNWEYSILLLKQDTVSWMEYKPGSWADLRKNLRFTTYCLTLDQFLSLSGPQFPCVSKPTSYVAVKIP